VKGENPFAVWGAAWSPDGKRIASTRYDFHLLVTDVASGQQLKVLETDSQPNGICWSSDGSTLVSSHDDGTILVWNAGKNSRMATLQDPTDYVWTYPMMWASDHAMLAAGGGDGVVRVWDTSSRKELVSLRGQTAGIWDVAWSPDMHWLATTSDDGTFYLWGV
jgi:WD40 repeat protein